MTLRVGILAMALLLAHSPSHAQQRNSGRTTPVLQVLTRIERQLRTTHYRHVTRVNERLGQFDFDCSGMASWVLQRASPEAQQTVLQRNGRGRPVARDYYDVLTRSSSESPSRGWLRIRRVRDLLPGDVLAWRRPPTVASQNTGHVAFVLAPPQQVDREGRRFLVRIADSTSIPHGEDTRPRTHQSGYGHGTILLVLDNPREEPVGYGWYGLRTRLDFRTHIAMGRPMRSRQQ